MFSDLMGGCGLRLLSAADYASVPWKNGAGVTTDILLLPLGESHETFDIRVSRAPIVSEGPFSSFPGIDRKITRLAEAPLELTFEDGRSETLERFQPLAFDSALAPRSGLPEGPTQVLNVMTRRGRWSSRVRVLHGEGTATLEPVAGALLLIYAVAGEWHARAALGEQSVREGETLLAADCGVLDLSGPAGAAVLIAEIGPAAA